MTSRALPPALVLLAAIAVLAGMDAAIKFLSQTNHTLIVVLGRYAFAAVFAAIIWLRAGAPALTGEMWRVHGLRGFVIAATATSFFWSLTVLPLAEAVTLCFFYPLIVPFVARLVIGERVRGASLAAALAGFAGVIVAVQGAPSPAQAPLHGWGVAAVVFSTCTFALSVVLMRARAKTDGPAIVGLLASLIPGLIVAGPAILIAPAPHWGDWPYFLLLGALAAAGMYLMAVAYAGAEAQQLAPIHYSELIWAAGYGYVLFHETPRPQVLLGAAVIVAACLYAAFEQRRSGRISKSGP